MAPRPLLAQLTNVHKVYRRGERVVHAVAGVSLGLVAGETLVLVGRSGSGKSTLLSLIGCLDVPSSGELSFAGRRVESLGDRERSRLRNRSIGFVFQSFHLIPELTVGENIATPLIYSDVPEGEWAGFADRALGSVGLSHRLMHRPSELSGGEAQRVAIARALVRDPELVLADEPTGNLDSVTGGEIADLLFSLKERGKALVVVTHDRSLAARADRQIELQDGRMVLGT